MDTKQVFTPEQLHYLRLLSRQYPTVQAAGTEIIRLKAVLNLPKATEHFMSDIHGEHEAFLHILNSGSGEVKEKLEELCATIQNEPRRFIAQEVIDFIDLPVMEDGQQVMRKADLRAFVLSGRETRVWPSGLTRFARQKDSFVVNSSQGGGFKDTWVLFR